MAKHKILVLEDDAIAQLTLMTILSSAGYDQIKIVDNGNDALAAVKSGEYDLALYDVYIKGDLDGIEVALKTNEISDIPIIFLTASSDNSTFNRATKTQNYGFLVKPYDPTAIVDHIQKALDAKSEYQILKKNEADYLLDLIYDTTEIGMCVTAEDRTFVKVNKAYCRTYGYTENELIGAEFVRVLPEDLKDKAREMHNQFLEGKILEVPSEWRVVCKDGTLKDIYVTAARFQSRDGKKFKVTTVTDITQKKRQTEVMQKALKQKEQYVKEIHHRVKNNLNIVSGLILMQAQKVKENPEVYKLFLESINRIKTLSFIHEKLYKRDSMGFIDFGNYARTLANNVFSSFSAESEHLQLIMDIDPVEMNIDKSISRGLIINELLSNSFKYAFPNGKKGTISLGIKKQEHQLEVQIKDDGIGLPDDFEIEKLDSLGMQLVHNLARQLEASLAISCQPGATFTLSFDIRNSN